LPVTTRLGERDGLAVWIVPAVSRGAGLRARRRRVRRRPGRRRRRVVAGSEETTVPARDGVVAGVAPFSFAPGVHLEPLRGG